MNKLFTKIATLALGAAMVVGVGVAVSSKNVSAAYGAAGDKILAYTASGFGSSYGVKTGSTTGTDGSTSYDWVVTAGGNSSSLGSNSKNFSSVTVLGSTYAKYGTPASISSSTKGVSVFALTTSMSNVGKISYSGSQGKGSTQKVYVLYSSDNTTFSQLTLTSGTQGSAFSSGTNFQFATCSGYFALLFKTTATSGDWRIDSFKADFYEGAVKTLSSIALSGTYPTTFTVGDTFSHSGMVVTATYSDSSTSDVSSEASWSSPDMSTAGNKTVTVSYGGKSAKYSITVNAATSPTLTLSSSTFTGFSGQSFTVTATYANLTSDFAWSASGSGTGSENITTTGDERDGTSTYTGTLTGTGTRILTASGGDVSSLTFTISSTKTTVDITKSSTSIQQEGSETLAVTHNAYQVDGLTWNSNNAKVAVDSDGKVTVASDATVGSTATITATSKVDTSVSDSCTVTVTEKPLSFTWDLSKKTYTTGTDTVTWSDTVASLTNSGTNATNYLGGDSNNRTSSRFYTGNNWVLTPSSGYTITSVVMTATSTSYASTFAESTFTNASASATDTTVTITPTNGSNAISAVIGGTCGFTAIEVYYSGGTPTPVTSYTVTDSVVNGTISPLSVDEGETLTATITPDTGYVLPESVSVTMGGSSTQFTYSNGVVTVVNVTGDIEISGECGAEPTPEPDEIRGTYTLVTNLSALTSDSLVVILNADADKAISTTQQTNNRAATSVSTSNNEFTITDSSTDVQVFKITNHGSNVISFYATNGSTTGYIYAAASGSNHLKTQSNDNANSQFTVTLSQGAFTIDAESSSNRGKMRYNPNNGSPMFSCYASNTTTGSDPIIYKLTSAYDPTAVASVSLDQTAIRIGIGSTVELTPTVLPETALVKTVSWSVVDADPSGCVTVNNGVVTGVSAGTATVVCTTTSGSKQATCSVEVAELDYGFYYKIENVSELNDGDKVVLVSSSNYGIAQNSISNKKIQAPAISSSYHWENDEFGNVSVDSTRVDSASFEWTIIEDSGSWKFTADPDDSEVSYLKSSGNSTDLAWEAGTSNVTWSISKVSNSDTFEIQNNGTSRYLSYRSDMQLYGAYSSIDESTYHSTRIYKLVSNPSVLGPLTCTGNGSYSGDWSSLESTFSGYSKGVKAYYKHATYTLEGSGIQTVVTATEGTNSDIAEFVSKYDDIVSKYGLTDFIGRNPSNNAGRIMLASVISQNASATAIIVVTSMIGLSAVGGYFFLRRRKENI